MPRIFDNIDLELLPALRETLNISEHADFCVGYFNLRGWKSIDALIERWTGGTGRQCRLLIGMQRLPHEELLEAYSLLPHEDEISNQVVIRLKRRLAEEFRSQLTIGAPTDADEVGLRKLSGQLKAGKVTVRLHLRHTLHAKLYLCFRPDPNNPITGFLGSSNLTLSGLSKQGELNVDVLDHDATEKLARWFDGRWGDRWCIDITKELIQVIDESWARPECPPPYQIYVKMAYHLAEEARAGLSEFTIPADMRSVLLEFQSAAVRIAARHLEKRGGVILGDVVGLGKTLMATALARMFQDPPRSLETLILCPKNLVGMWEDHAHRYRLIAKVVSVTQTQSVLPDLRRYRIVIIDESHNLRNREGRRWAVVRDYISRNASKCILLSATPYNKAYLDLANQIRLFLEPEDVVGIRPEEYLRRDCEGRPDEFTRRHQCPLNCLAAFEKSQHPDDWREMMRLFMVRRTRSFVERNYACAECPTCQTVVQATQDSCSTCSRTKAKADRSFLALDGGSRFYFPKRLPKTLHFRVRDKHSDDQYARLYSDAVVDTIRMLHLPRYGLANYLKPTPDAPPTTDEAEVMKNLSRAGKRLIGFCRTNLFKRLESSGHAFLLSVRRHILRNFIYLHALDNGLAVPLGTQDSSLFDTRTDDHDSDSSSFGTEDQQPAEPTGATEVTAKSLEDFARAGTDSYALLKAEHRTRFEWLRPDLFIEDLAKHLRQDAKRLFSILELAGEWEPVKDEKLAELHKLLTKKHPSEKILLFSQFADTVTYLNEQLRSHGLARFAAVTGDTEDPSDFARRFSPDSNNVRDKISATNELRVLVATDVLSEGQNLQDAAIVVNYDLPWAIIRLIQRAGRVDRIGQRAEQILCYSFLPAEGVERVIRLRARVRQRLQENAEVVGTDETFFEDEKHDSLIRDLFTERSGLLDDTEDNEVDLASLAYQIWKNACDSDPGLKKSIPDMANVVFSTKALSTVSARLPGSGGANPDSGVMVYVRTADGNDALAWMDEQGRTITESQHEILRAAACEPATPALPRLPGHHTLVRQAVASIQKEHITTGGQLGKPASARRRVYERLKDYAIQVKGSLFDIKPLHQAIDAIYEAPLTEAARDLLNREIKSGIENGKLAELVLALFEEDRLCVPQDNVEARGAEDHLLAWYTERLIAMPLDFQRARPLLQTCELRRLFIEELGWEPSHQKLTLRAGESDYAFTAISEKRGFVAWLCESPEGGLPDHPIRLKLDRKLSETSFEHLIVFVTGDRSRQSWMWVRRKHGKPLAARTHEYQRGQPGDSLLQKLQILYVSLEEEEAGLSTTVVAGRARAAFDVDRVTKAFYGDFDTHREGFLKFIDGIGDVADREWYASVMLNRLMFVYFIQRKGFLDGDRDYLRNRLDRCKTEQGKDKFYSFYRYFLLRLFHEGFGRRRQDRAPDLEKLLGNIPYLNGGLFDVHDIEKRYGKDIQIPDKAFERIFDYFDKYQWHLDERPLRNDKEINPDVLGYIFEKYINQKQMGAYYTKEDITEYIGKNTCLPFLLDAARAKCKVAFENPNGPTVWDLLRDSPDRYIYGAVRHGAEKALPPEIAIGLDTATPGLIERRKTWNKPAAAEYALPTETWREVVARRQRYEEVRKKLAAGEVRDVNDFITFNLDIRQFAQDLITNSEGPDLLRAVWYSIEKVTILDPTCGSGAFLFAALNILEPLYESCLERMEAFVADDDRMRAKSPEDAVRELIAAGESVSLEFKSTARWNVKEGKADKAMEQVIVKTVAAFLNTKGGDLLIGVEDNGKILGIESDLQMFGADKRTRDSYENWVTTLLLGAFGKQYASNLHISFARLDSHDVCRIAILPAPSAVYVKESNQDTLYVRTGNSTRSLSTSEAVAYHQRRFTPSVAVPPAKPPKASGPKKYADFRKVLDTVAAHPNLRYFVLKSIILNNLFGVDIMEEAVEICKLRLFLKLAAQVEPDSNRDNLGIEPLPDIDFNIRAGNTLVGYATYEEVKRTVTSSLDFDSTMENIAVKAADLQQTFDAFRQRQTEGDGSVPAADKLALQKRLKTLEDELNAHLSREYGVKKNDKSGLATWVESYKPFHWFLHFYGILSGGGFDVIVGNPPWKEYSSVKQSYAVRGYETEPSGNLYAFCTERSVSILSPKGFLSFIVQLPIVSSSRMNTARNFLTRNASFIAAITCDDRPGKLFDGLQHCRSTIFILKHNVGSSEQPLLVSSGYRRWATEVRDALFPVTVLTDISDRRIRQGQFPKVASRLHVSAYTKLFASGNQPLGLAATGSTNEFVFYQESAQYWVKAAVGVPYYSKNGRVGTPAHGRHLFFSNEGRATIAFAVLNSSLFYTYYITYGDCFHVSDSLASGMPVPHTVFEDKSLRTLGVKLMRDLDRNAERKSINTKDGDKISYAEFRVGESKPIIDEIDTALAKHYGFTAEELDFILNYDIKYRLGRDAEGPED